ncbi:RHS repeat-associated core domain-containing protein [Streptomyces rhizosphaericola]|uniref:RHS repeat-associated core domain-containing protein n=1 Tax=Streptomyces rhizosphaericola TaxID=2564098 RepID=UPI003BF5549D
MARNAFWGTRSIRCDQAFRDIGRVHGGWCVCCEGLCQGGAGILGLVCSGACPGEGAVRVFGEKFGALRSRHWQLLTVGALVLALAGGTVSAEAVPSPSPSSAPAPAAGPPSPLPTGGAAATTVPPTTAPQHAVAGPEAASTTDNAVYAYDAAHRLVGVSDPAGETARYRYDQAGNRLGIDRFPSSSLSILSLVPVKAAVGSEVTLSGSGFSTTPAANSVRFGSAVGQVVSASAHRLVVKVPAGAAVGKVKVVVGSASAESSETFALAQGAPTVNEVTPNGAQPGTDVVVSGTGFAPDAADNVVRFKGAIAQVVAASETQLTVTVPPDAALGRVQVSTPNGSAQTSRDFNVFYPVDEPRFESVESTSLTDDSPPTVEVINPGNQAKILFVALEGDAVSFAFSDTTFNSAVGLRLLDPVGREVGTRGSFSRNGGDWDVRNLPLTGQYSLIIDPGPSNIGAVTVTASRAVRHDLVIGGASATLETTRPGQDALWSFSAPLGTSLSLGLDTRQMPKATSVTLYGPDDKSVATVYASAASEALLSVDSLPLSGTYLLVADTVDAGTGRLTVTGSTYADAGTAEPAGAPIDLTIGRAGQVGVARFSAAAGQRPSLGIAATGFEGKRVSAQIRDLEGKSVANVSLAGGDTTQWDSPTLTVSGIFTVVFSPPGLAVGSLRLTASLPVSAGSLSVTGNAVSASNTRFGQNIEATFEGASGAELSLGVSDSTFSGYLSVNVIAPSGKKVVTSSIVPAGAKGATISVPVLAEPGTYLITIDPYQGLTGTLKLALSASVQVSLTADAPSTPATVSRVGQQVHAEFTASDTVMGFALTDNTLAAAANVRLFSSSGGAGQLVGTVSKADSFARYFSDLVEGATYTLQVTPAEGATGSMALWLSRPLQAGTLSSSAPTTRAEATRPGQPMEFKVPASSGQGAAVVFSANTLTQASNLVVVAPGGATELPVLLGSKATGEVDLRAPLSSGTYRILVQPAKPATGAVTATFIPDVEAGSLSLNGPAVPAAIAVAGQNARYTFSGIKGQKPTLTIASSPAAWDMSVFTPEGKWLVNQRYTSATAPSFALPALPADGTYVIVVDPTTLATGTWSLALTVTTPTAKTASSASTQSDTPGQRTTQPSAKVLPTGPDAWQPGKTNLAGHDWVTGKASAPRTAPALKAPPGVAALTGRVLKLDGKPLAKATVKVGEKSSRTDPQGRFLLAGIDVHETTLVVDGSSANTRQRQYGRFDIHVRPKAGTTVDIGFPVWMTPLDTKHTVRFSAPATSDVVLKTPQIPGLEIRIPKGSVVRDEKGNAVTELGITAIPIDRPPFPLPQHSVVPVYFTVQPGGSYVFPEGAQVIYPNYTRAAPGTRVEFMDYDPEGKGWYVYGHGQVSRDGRQVVPDAKTKIWAFHGAMFNFNDLVPWDLPMLDDAIAWLSGDPVDLNTGLLTDSRTDLAVSGGNVAADVTRTYWQGDTQSRAFGIGRDLTYNAFFNSKVPYQEVDLYLPGGKKIHYVRTSPGNGVTDGVFAATGSPGDFQGSQVVWDGGWKLKFRDGTTWFFPEYSALKEIRDRHGNTLKLTRLAGRGEITRITSSDGNWISLAYDAAHRVREARDNTGRTTSYTYDTAGRLSTVTDPVGKVSSFTYDGTSNRIRTAKDARGITYMTNTFHPDGKIKEQILTEGQKYSFEYTQTGAGKVTSATVTQPGGSVRRVEFNADGYGVKDTQAYGSDLARPVTYERGPRHRIDAITDAYGRRTELTYDANGYVTRATELAGTAQARTSGTTTFDGPYDQPTATSDRLGNTTRFTYDADGNLKTATDPEGRTTTFTYMPDGQIKSAADNAGAITEYTYDNGNLAAIKDAVGRTSRQFTDAAGRVSAITDPARSLTRITYDRLNQPSKVIGPLGHATSFGYDDNGNLTTLTDARNNATTWAYDDADRPKSATDPLGAQASFEYDAAGFLKKATSRSGLVATSEHDLLGRTKNVKYGVNTLGVAESTATYEYDTLDLLKKITDTQAGTQSFAYDAYERTETVTSPTGTVNYTYDAADRRETMTAGGATTTYGYDRSSILTSLTSQGRKVTFHLDETGRETSADIPGGFTRATSTDKTGVVRSIAYTQGTKNIGQLSYTRDERGLQTGLTGSLANVALPAAETGTVFGKDNRITTYSGRSFTYDADGQLKNDGLRTYTWNARGQLTGLNRSGQSSIFGYEPLGTRNSKTVTGAQTKFLTDGSNPAVEQDSSGSPKATVAMSGLDEFLTRTEGAKTQVYLTDALGTVLGLADPDGTIATTYTYDPNGQPTTSGTASSNPYTFTGRENDGTGLLYYRARYYDPQTGRFISQDPIGQAGGINLYQYALSSPTTYTDPTGNTPMATACIAGGLLDGGLDWLGQRLSGRKVNWGQVGLSAATGCLTAMLGTAAAAKLAMPSMGRCLTPNSFTGETAVVRADGSHKAIKDIKVGDQVLATDPVSGESGPRKVTALIKSSGDKQLVDISIGDQDGSTGSFVSATEGHPFWVADSQEWVDAGQLRTGQWLQTSAGTWVQISAVRAHDEVTTVYNLTVDDLHTYHVSSGEATALVHNTGGKKPCGSFGPSDLDGIFDPALGRNLKPPKPGGSSVDDAGKSQKATEEAIEQAEQRKTAVSRAPSTVQKVVDGPQAPGAHGPAEAIVAVAIVTARGAQRVKLWWRERRSAAGP